MDFTNLFDLCRRDALITGAEGLGRAIARV